FWDIKRDEKRAGMDLAALDRLVAPSFPLRPAPISAGNPADAGSVGRGGGPGDPTGGLRPRLLRQRFRWRTSPRGDAMLRRGYSEERIPQILGRKYHARVPGSHGALAGPPRTRSVSVAPASRPAHAGTP